MINISETLAGVFFLLAILFFLIMVVFILGYLIEINKGKGKLNNSSLAVIDLRNPRGLIVSLLGFTICILLVLSNNHIQRNRVIEVVNGLNPQVILDDKQMKETNAENLLLALSNITGTKHHYLPEDKYKLQISNKLQISSSKGIIDLIIKSDSKRNNSWWVHSSNHISIGYISGWKKHP